MPKLPANNRMHSSSALQTHGVWSNVIGYDPYAPEKKGAETIGTVGPSTNAYENYQGLLALARLTGGSNISQRGTCKRCGGVGHLTFQCRNFLKNKPDLNGNEISSTSSESEGEDGHNSGPEDPLKEKPKKDSVYREEKENDIKIPKILLDGHSEHHTSKHAHSPVNDKHSHKKHHKKDKKRKRHQSDNSDSDSESSDSEHDRKKERKHKSHKHHKKSQSNESDHKKKLRISLYHD